MMEELSNKGPVRLRQSGEFSLFDLELVRLILRGGSVLDWHRMNISRIEIDELIASHLLDPEDLDVIALVTRVRDEAVVYLRETLGFPVPRPVRQASLTELLEMSSDGGNRHRQFCACILLKVMHIINHFDASEARQALAMADQDLFRLAERKIYREITGMMAERMPVVEFMGGRKKRSSMVTKLLSKDAPLSAQVFDKLRFRVITAKREDVVPVINYLARSLFPFNYVLSGESYNSLFSFADLCAQNTRLSSLMGSLQLDPSVELRRDVTDKNRHSSPNYQVVHWVADMPLRLPSFQSAYHTDGVNPVPRPIVYVRTELQILDRQANRANEHSDAAHTEYKARQRKTVTNRLRLGIRSSS